MAQDLFRTVKLYYGKNWDGQHVWYSDKNKEGNPNHENFVITLSSEKYNKEESWWRALYIYASKRSKNFH